MRKFLYNITIEVVSDGNEMEAREDVFDSLSKTGELFGVTSIESIKINYVRC